MRSALYKRCIRGDKMEDMRNEIFPHAADTIKTPAFKVEVVLRMKFDLAFALANFILDNDCENKALLALAHLIVGD